MQVFSTDIIHTNNKLISTSLFLMLLANSLNLHAIEGFFDAQGLGVYPGATDVSSADFNDDGIDDLVMIYGLLESVPVASPLFSLQDIQGNFTDIQSGPIVIGNRVLAADFNNDLAVDLLITGGVSDGGLVMPGNTAIYFNSGDWSQGSGFDFTAPLNLGGLHHAPEVAVGDLDGDMDVDIVLGVNSPSGIGTVEIWINQGLAQGGTMGTFIKSDFIENMGPYDAISALSLAQVSTKDTSLDLLFARQGSNKINIAFNDGNSGFISSIDEIAVIGAVNDLNLVDTDYLVAALTNAPSTVFEVERDNNGDPTGYPLRWTVGTDIQQSEKIIPIDLGTQPAFFLSSSFDGDRNVGVTSLMLYGFTLIGVPSLEPQRQCLLGGGTPPAKGLVAYSGKRPNGSDFTDLNLLSYDSERFSVINFQPPNTSICCISETQFIAVNAVAAPESPLNKLMPHQFNQVVSGINQSMVWLDSFQKLKDIRRIIMPLTTDSQRYESLYAQHELQIITLMASDAGLRTAWTNVLTSWNQPLTALLDGSDGNHILTGQQMAHVATFLGLLQNEPGVGATISDELALIQPLNSYAGGSLQEFTLDALNLVSPIIFKNSFE